MHFVSYLFSPIPGSAFNYALTLNLYAAFLIALAIAVKVLITIKKDDKALKKVYKRMPGHLIWIGITIIILNASRTSGIPYLSMRFLIYITVLISFYVIGLNIYRFFTKYPEMKTVTKPKPKKEDKKPTYSTKKRK